MEELRSIIIDDERFAIADLAEQIERAPGIGLAGSFGNVDAAMAFLNEQGRVDIIFCDIRMPGTNGIQAAESIRPFCDFLIYVTAHREHAIDAFAVSASGYLIKPVRQQALTNELAKVTEKRKHKEIQPKNNDYTFFIKGGPKNDFIKIDLRTVIYIKSLGNYIEIYTIKGNQTTYMSLKAAEKALKNFPQMCRISRFTIVNIDHITDVDGKNILLSNGESCGIGDSYKSAFHAVMRERTLN